MRLQTRRNCDAVLVVVEALVFFIVTVGLSGLAPVMTIDEYGDDDGDE